MSFNLKIKALSTPQFVQDSEYIEDELVASSYYADEPIHQECMTCKDAEFRIEDLEKQVVQQAQI